MDTESIRDPKVTVEVVVDFQRNGDMIPREIVWIDDSGEEVRYPIDRIKDVCQAASRRAGGQGDRYTILVNGQETYLFFERSANLTGRVIGTWYVERRSA